MHGNILPALPGQSVTSLSDLAKTVRAEHAAVVSALSDAVERAIRCGSSLAAAKGMAGHGRWLEFLRTCGIGERTAQQYMQLARLAEQNRTAGTDLAGLNGAAGTNLAGMTIKGAIRHLAPPKSSESPKPTPSPKQITKPKPLVGGHGRRVAHVDIIELWLAASPTDRAKAIDSIGLEQLLTAIPVAWRPLLAERLVDHLNRPIGAPATGPAIPPDFSIPDFLRRPLLEVAS